jgi:hypothetical protein
MFTQTTNAQTSSSLDKTLTTTLGFHLVSKNDDDGDDDTLGIERRNETKRITKTETNALLLPGGGRM